MAIASRRDRSRSAGRTRRDRWELRPDGRASPSVGTTYNTDPARTTRLPARYHVRHDSSPVRGSWGSSGGRGGAGVVLVVVVGAVVVVAVGTVVVGTVVVVVVGPVVVVVVGRSRRGRRGRRRGDDRWGRYRGNGRGGRSGIVVLELDDEWVVGVGGKRDADRIRQRLIGGPPVGSGGLGDLVVAGGQ